MLSKFFIACAVLVAVVAGAKIEEDEGVLVLTDSNFDAALEAHNPLLVEFYAPWCGHCKKLAPEYAEAAAELKPKGLYIAKVDATEEKELGKRFKIEGFPTLKFFRGSAEAMSDYGGGRTKADIVAWVSKKSAPATVPVTTKAEVTAAVEASEVAFLGLFTAGEAPLSKAFATLASASEAGAFLVAVGSEASALRTAYGVGAGDVVIALNTFEGQANQVVLEEGSPLDAFVSGNSLPHVVAFSQATVSKIFAGAIKTHYLLFADPTATATYAPLIASFRTLAAGSVGELLFVSVDPKGEGNDKILQYFGVTDANIPTAAIVKMGDAGMKKFMFADAGVAGGDLGEGLGEFLAAFKKGALKASLKSQPIPAPDATSDVRVLVGKNFEAEVLEGPEKLALVEFYAPWCGHCKSLMPIWEELGTFYKGDSSVGVFKMDATENEVDVPGVNVKGFPTIIGFVKGADGKKNVVEYDGARELKGFKEFIAKNGGSAGAAADSEDDLEL